MSEKARTAHEGTSRNEVGLLDELMDPNHYTAALDVDSASSEALLRQLELMMMIRRTEEIIAELVTSGEVRCPCHLAIGQEACAVGIAEALNHEKDKIFGAHRSHGHYLAMGGDVDELLAEVFGKQTGCSGGMGGSMHLIAPERGVMGTVPIVGATVPMAVGAGLASRLEGNGGVAVAFFGDGAMEEGVVQESLNFAARHNVPVIFACENNLFSSHLHIGLRQTSDSVARYAIAHGIEAETIDGNDVIVVSEAAQRAVVRGREHGQPTFIEMVTYRWRGHVGPSEDQDVGVERSSDLHLWKERDPIRRLREGLVEVGALSEEEISAMGDRVEKILVDAVSRARTAPFPSKGTTSSFLYSTGVRT